MKRLCCLLLITLLMLLAATAMAETGTYGGGTWEMDDQGVLTFTGPADLTGWRTNGTDFQMKVTKVVYGPEVTGVSPGAYSYANNLTAFEVDPGNPNCCSVNGVLYSKDMTELIEAPAGMKGSYTIPEGVKVIRESAFIGSALTELILPESLEEIEDQAFWNAEFKSLHIPAKTSEIAASALNLHGIESFTVSEGNTGFSAKDGVLFNQDGTRLIHYPVADSAEEYTVPQGVESIGYNSFAFADSLKKLTVPEGVTAIGSSAFNYCTAMQEISLPSTLEAIESGVFRTTNQLRTVRYAGTAEAWKTVRIEDDNVMLLRCTVLCADGNVEPEPEEGTIGDGITYVMDYKTGTLTVSGAGEWNRGAFHENLAIEKAILNEGVSEIGCYAFGFSRNLTEVTIPSTVTRIQDEAFYYCSALTTLTIPASVTSLGNNAFAGCDALQEITYGGTKAEWEALRANTSDWGLDFIDIVCTDGIIEGQNSEPDPGETGLSMYQIFPVYYMAEGAGFDVILSGGLYMEPQFAHCVVNYTDETAQQDPEGPQWTMEQLEGTATAEITHDPGWDVGFSDIKVRVLPEKAETDRWRVTCTWNGETWAQEIALEFRKVPTLPEGVEQIGTGDWTVEVGDIIDPKQAFRFTDGWHLDGEETDIILYGTNSSSATEGDVDEQGMHVEKALTPGTYSCEILLACANLRWVQPTQLIITGEGGDPTGLNVYTVWRDYYMAGGTGFDVIRNGLYMEPQFAHCVVNYTDETAQQDPEGPQWTMEQLEGTATAEITHDPGWDVGFSDIKVRVLPEKAETDRWRVTCTWNGETWAQEIALEFRKVPTLPEGVEQIGTGDWTVEVGDIIDPKQAFRFTDGWHLDGEETDIILYGTNSSSATEGDVDEQGMHVEKALTPGTYSCEILLTCANLRWVQPTQLIITGEGGDPSGLNVYTVWPEYYMARGTGFDGIWNGLYMEPQIAHCVVNYTDETVQQDPEGPQWTLEQLEGTATAEITHDPGWDIGFSDIKVRVLPESAETDRWRVTCNWNGKTWKTEITMEFREMSTLPQGVEPIGTDGWTVQVGEIIDPQEAYRFKDGWHLDGEATDIILYGIDSSSAVEGSVNDQGMWIDRAVTPGTYKCEILLSCANLRWIYSTNLTITEAGVEPSNPCGADGDNVTWTLDADGRLVLTGSGAVADFASTNPPWRFEADSIKTAAVGDGITRIGVRTFWFAVNMTEVTIPSSVKSIGENAFGNCTGLVLVHFGGTPEEWAAIDIHETGNEALASAEIRYAGTHIHQAVVDPAVEATDTAFGWTEGSHCSVCGEVLVPQERIAPLDSITSPDGGQPAWVLLTNGTLILYGEGETGEYDSEENPSWFAHRDEITSVVVEDGITRIGEYAFYECERIRSVEMADSVVSIGSYAFQRCTALAELKLSNALTEIGNCAFNDCTALASVTLPGSLRTIGYEAFNTCSLSAIGIPAGADTKTWDFFYAGEDGEGYLCHVKLPSAVATVGYAAFYGNPLPKDRPDYVLPSELSAIESEAFRDTNPRFVWLPESVISIESAAFAGCTRLAYIYIPYGCESIGENALPAGTVILGFGDDGGYRCEAMKYAAENGFRFLPLEDPNGGNG